MKALLALLPLLAASPTHAAVSPYYDRVYQLKAVIESPQVARALVGQEIISITEASTLRSPLTFTVATPSCSTAVTLEAHPPGRPGLTTYTVKSVPIPTCLGN